MPGSPAAGALLWTVRLSAPVAHRTATATGGTYNGPAVTFHGTVKSLTKKEIIIDLDGAEPDGEQTLTLRRSGKTKFFKDERRSRPLIFRWARM